MKHDHPPVVKEHHAPEHIHNVHHVEKHHKAGGHVHHHHIYGEHKAGHKKHHEHIEAMCGGGMAKGKK